MADCDLFGNGQNHEDVQDEKPSADSLDKVHSTLRQFVRDWADEGEVNGEEIFCELCGHAS